MGDICPLLSSVRILGGSSEHGTIACIGARCVCWGILDLEGRDPDDFFNCIRSGCTHFGIDYREMGWTSRDERI
jgi:hypothetical protein